jgi:hypothetical protein
MNRHYSRRLDRLQAYYFEQIENDIWPDLVSILAAGVPYCMEIQRHSICGVWPPRERLVVAKKEAGHGQA